MNKKSDQNYLHKVTRRATKSNINQQYAALKQGVKNLNQNHYSILVGLFHKICLEEPFHFSALLYDLFVVLRISNGLALEIQNCGCQ